MDLNKTYHGFNTPLFSLRTKNSSGIGEFLDIIPLIDLCCETGFSIIQLLPLNDTGRDPSPYNAESAFALNPIYISLQTLPFVTKEDLEPFQKLDELKNVAYEDVLNQKIEFFKKYFDSHFPALRDDISYRAFVETTPWLKPYALFKVLKVRYNSAWSTWPEEFQNPTDALINQLYEKEGWAMEFYYLLQYFSFRQLKFVKNYATEKGILLKGDIPILISPDSLDVWLYRENFNTDLTAGAPPDMFSPDGQNWGFPIYLWDTIEKNNFQWWKTRLTIASEFYDILRIDHIIGFYRMWTIEKGGKAKDGAFIPADKETAIKQGEFLLSKLFSFTNMFPIGEDLGLYIDHIRRSITKLGIPGLKIVRWERYYGAGENFIAYKDYPRLSLTTLSTHDTETLAEWWIRFPRDAKQFCDDFNLTYKENLDAKLRLEILKGAHTTNSSFHINLFDEYLSLVYPENATARINIPGKILESNWCHRYPETIEQIANNTKFVETLKSII